MKEKSGQEQNEEKTTLKYRDSGIDERIIRAVEELGFDHMTPIQEQAIPVFSSGKDVIGQAQTGRRSKQSDLIIIVKRSRADTRQF